MVTNKNKRLFKGKVVLASMLVLGGCSSEITTTNKVKHEDKVSHKKPVSDYARSHLYELGDVIDSIEKLSMARDSVVMERVYLVVDECNNYKDSSSYSKYKKVSKNSKEQKEFERVTKIRKKVIKVSKKIEDSDIMDSERYAEEFIDEYEKEDSSYISNLYLKYSQ